MLEPRNERIQSLQLKIRYFSRKKEKIKYMYIVVKVIIKNNFLFKFTMWKPDLKACNRKTCFTFLICLLQKKIIPGIQCNIFEIFHKLSHTPLDKHEPHVISLFYSYFLHRGI